MSNPPFEFVINYQGLSKEQIEIFIDDAFRHVDLMLEEQLSGRPGFFVATQKLLTINPSSSNAAIAVYNTYEVTKIIMERLLNRHSNITLIKDIKEIFI